MIFGLYLKTGSVSADTAQGALDAFSLGGKRTLQRMSRERFICATATDGGCNLPSHESEGLLAIASGHAMPAAGSSGLSESVVQDLASGSDLTSPPKSMGGSYVFAAYREQGHELFIGNDAFGFHPLFLVETEEFVAFCSEYEPLLTLPGVSSELDEGAVAEYYLFGITLANKTLIDGVRMLPAGTIRSCKDGGSATDLLHDPLDVKVDRNRSFEEHAKFVGEAFGDASRRTSDAFPDAEVSLTGGADTRLILSALTPEQRKGHSFVTHYGEKDAEARDRDVVIAKMLAEAAGLRHETLFIDGGHSEFEPATFGLHRAKIAGQRTIAGVNGGEYLGGACVDVGLFPALAVTREAVDRKLAALFEPPFIARLPKHPYDVLRGELESLKAEDNELHFWLNGFSRSFFSQLYFGSAGVRTSTWMVPWQMQQRLYSPFADPEVLRALLSVPFEYLSGYRLYNAVYKLVFPEFTGLPTNSGLAVRSDSVLTMSTDGEEPKRARLDRTEVSRANGVARISKAGAAWSRGIYNRGSIEAKLSSELVANEKPTIMTRIKNGYTKSFLFKARHALPIHGLLMKWKAKSETASAAELNSQWAPAFVDFESWCEYADIKVPEDSKLASS